MGSIGATGAEIRPFKGLSKIRPFDELCPYIKGLSNIQPVKGFIGISVKLPVDERFPYIP